MNENDFIGDIAGKVRWVYNRRYCYFRANPLPFSIKMSVRMRRRFRSAVMSVCRLDGRLHQLSDRERGIVVRALDVKEAVFSSAMDCESPSIDDVLYPKVIRLSEGARTVKDVERYIESLRSAFRDSSGSRKLTSFNISELHRELMDTEKGRVQSPGELRVDQNLIGRKGDTLESARFVPVDPVSLPDLMENMMKYVNTSVDDPLYKIALVHYQFESIHPMRDGNGRMGRLLMASMMFSEGMMTYAMPPMSEYLFGHRSEYIASLYNVSAKDDFDTWFSLFLDALDEASQRAIRTIDNIISLRDRMLGDESNRNKKTVMESLFDNPYIMVSDVMERTGLTRPGALKLMASMEQEGIVQEISGRQRGKVYLSKSIRKALFGM